MGVMSAQKSLQGLKAEMGELLGGTEENGAFIINVIYLPCRQMNDFLQRFNSEKEI